jgi:hypothetical protein
MQAMGPAIVARGCNMLCDEIKNVLGSYHYGRQHLSRRLSRRRCWAIRMPRGKFCGSFSSIRYSNSQVRVNPVTAPLLIGWTVLLT